MSGLHRRFRGGYGYLGYLTMDFFCYQDDLDLPVKVLRGHLGRKMKRNSHPLTVN